MSTRTLNAYGLLKTDFGDYYVFWQDSKHGSLFLGTSSDLDTCADTTDGRAYRPVQLMRVECPYLLKVYTTPKVVLVLNHFEHKEDYKEAAIENLMKMWEGDYAE